MRLENICKKVLLKLIRKLKMFPINFQEKSEKATIGVSQQSL